MAKIPQTINSPLLKVWGFHFGLQFCEQYTQYTVNYRKEKGRGLGIGRKSLNRASYFLCAKKTNKKKKKKHITGLWPCLIEKGYISKHVQNEICIYISNSEYFHF